jgi:hypothetical protein
LIYRRKLGRYDDIDMVLSTIEIRHGAGQPLWRVLAGLLQLVVATLGGRFVLSLTGAEGWLYAALALGVVLYGSLSSPR